MHICVPHNDVAFQKYLGVSLLQTLNVGRLYVEISQEKLDDLRTIADDVRGQMLPNMAAAEGCQIYQEALLLGQRQRKQERQHLGLPPLEEPHPVDLAYVVVCSMIHQIPIVAIDVSSAVCRPIEQILHNVIPSTPQEQENAFNTRLTHDDHMAESITADYLAGNRNIRHMVITGPMHRAVSEKVPMQSFTIFERSTLSTALGIYPRLRSKIKTDCIFLYSILASITLPNLLYYYSKSFLPSKYATADQPYGPYKDRYCSPRNGINTDILLLSD